jgi:hypothetical protein
MEFVHLIGSEQVQNAAQSIRQAAESMSQAAGSIDESLRRHQMFMDDWLCRLEQVLTKVEQK